MSRASVCSGLPMLLIGKDKGFRIMPYVTVTTTTASLCLLLMEMSKEVTR